jgi:hypothetical protein
MVRTILADLRQQPQHEASDRAARPGRELPGRELRAGRSRSRDSRVIYLRPRQQPQTHCRSPRARLEGQQGTYNRINEVSRGLRQSTQNIRDMLHQLNRQLDQEWENRLLSYLDGPNRDRSAGVQ